MPKHVQPRRVHYVLPNGIHGKTSCGIPLKTARRRKQQITTNGDAVTCKRCAPWL